MSEEKTLSIREKLAEEVGRAAWKDLRPHAVRGQLIFVDPALALLDVAEAVAEDRSADVEAWVGAGQLRKLDEGELERGDARPPARIRHRPALRIGAAIDLKQELQIMVKKIKKRREAQPENLQHLWSLR